MSTFLFKFHISRFCGSTILNVWFSSKFDFRKLSTVLIGSFLMEITFFSQISPFFFQKHDWSLKVHWAKETFSDNHGRKILELYNDIPQGRFWNLISLIGIWHPAKNLGMQVASWVAKPLKAEDLWKFGNIRKISNLAGDNIVPSLPCRS